MKTLNIFQYILCYGSTFEILLFAYSVNKFQYILCYGSTESKSGKSKSPEDFNTSYVMVQLYRSFCLEIFTINFNTSYVMVQLHHF